MRYTKPTIASLGYASTAIQTVGIKGFVQLDANESARPQQSTGGSYDLDE
jgi:hypothetical protein